MQWSYSETRNGEKAFTRISPRKFGDLVLHIKVSFPGYGSAEETFYLPNPVLFDKILEAKTTGWPVWLRAPSKIASGFGWRHHENICWPNGDAKTFLANVLLHRAQDLLGVLSLLCRNGLFAGEVFSHCSGHLADVHAVKLADNCLTKI